MKIAKRACPFVERTLCAVYGRGETLGIEVGVMPRGSFGDVGEIGERNGRAVLGVEVVGQALTN